MHIGADIDTLRGMRQGRKTGWKRFRALALLAMLTSGSYVTAASTNETAWSMLPARSIDQPGYTYFPSPGDWRSHTIYQIITDRFYDGDPSNNSANPKGMYNPLSMDSIHGGDFSGVTMHLDYIKHLGFNVIWISPVFLNHRGAYHGYHINDFNQIDPHWGTLDDLRKLVDEAHARGMYVIIDVVFNHTARLLTSDESGFPAFSQKGYPMRWIDDDHWIAPPFNNIELFHNHGSIQDWENEQHNVLGDLQGLADLRTEREDVRQWLLESHKALISATDCDGFRIDTAHHVELDFWKNILPQLRSHAAELGKTNFLMFAEALRGRDEDVSVLTREGAYPSALYYPYYFTLHDIWADRHPTRKITERWNNLSMYGESASRQLVTFGDNHDRARLLNEAYLAGDTNRLKALLTMLYASPGIPCVYYGTEQGFSGSKGHRAREPMFNPLQAGIPDYFNADSDLARFISRLNKVHRQYPALSYGTEETVLDEDQAGLFVFRRLHPDGDMLIIVNNSTSNRTYQTDDPLINALTGETYDGTITADTTLILTSENIYRPIETIEDAPVIKTGVPQLAHQPFAAFTIDGFLDHNAIVVATNASTSLHAAYNAEAEMLYLAVTPSSEGHDRFIMLSFTNRRDLIKAPWEKNDFVPGYDISVNDEGDSDFTSVRGTTNLHWSISHTNGVCEAGIKIDRRTGSLFVRTAEYETVDRGNLKESSELPASGLDQRFIEINLEALSTAQP